MPIFDVASLASTLIASNFAETIDAASFQNIPTEIDIHYREVAQSLFEKALQGEESLTAANIRNLHRRQFEIIELGGMIVAKGILHIMQYQKYPKGGKLAEETYIGADYGVRVTLDCIDLYGSLKPVYIKGVLIQAKLAKTHKDRTILTDVRRAQEQASAMLNVSRSSYMQIYHPTKPECYYIPAASFVSKTFPNRIELRELLSNLYYDGNQAFYTNLIRSFNGDVALDPLSDEIFSSLGRETAYGIELVSQGTSLKDTI